VQGYGPEGLLIAIELVIARVISVSAYLEWNRTGFAIAYVSRGVHCTLPWYLELVLDSLDLTPLRNGKLVNCATLLLGIGGVLISLSKAMSP